MKLERTSGCKVNFLLNILGRRPDGFHELETILVPVAVRDRLEIERKASGIEIHCDHPQVPCDERNLVHRAAHRFFAATGIRAGVSVRIEKRVPVAAGLGGGSANAAAALTAFNDLFDRPLAGSALEDMAAGLGADVPFFLQDLPAKGIGRGERIEPIDWDLPALNGFVFLLIHPGFGVPTAWAYSELARCPDALNGAAGRADALVRELRSHSLESARSHFFNSLEAPVLRKYPVLALYQEFLLAHGAVAALMSGSGSTTFALIRDGANARRIEGAFREEFGAAGWSGIVPVLPEEKLD